MMITSGPNGDYGQISIIDGKDDGKLPPDSSLSVSLDPIIQSSPLMSGAWRFSKNSCRRPLAKRRWQPCELPV